MKNQLAFSSLAAATSLLLTACGGGGGSSSSNAPPAISGFRIESANVAPAHIRFVLADQESDPTSVELFYQPTGSAPQRITQLTGSQGNPLTLSTSPTGVDHDLVWNFPAEALIPDDGSFFDGVTVFASLAGSQKIIPGANAAELGLGNDPPRVEEAPGPRAAEVDGIVALPLRVSDSSDDVVSIRVEYDLTGDVPDAGWRLARPGGLPAAQPTPAFAFVGVTAPREGVNLVFFWNTDFDLAELERDVRVRFTAVDPVVEGTPVQCPTFRVDNNAEPIAFISDGLLISNPDERRGIPIPFRVIDEESDEVQMIFQWRKVGESFPSLPADSAAIQAILADPVQRSEHHICTEFQRPVEGRVVPVDATHVRLPELASSAAQLLAGGMVGREVSILRASNVPAPVAASWATNPLQGPVAALPIGDGLDAVVLDSPGQGTWRLRQIALATGEVVRDLVTQGPGNPTAMIDEAAERSVLVATHQNGLWQVSRVDLASGLLTPLVTASASIEHGPIRGIASLGTNAALITVGHLLVRLDWSVATSPSIVTLRANLSTPWGVVIDPLNTNRIYLAERDAPVGLGVGRILALELDSNAQVEVVTSLGAEQAFPRPEAIALDRSRARLLVITQHDPASGNHELRGVDLGGPSSHQGFELASGLAGKVGSVALGLHGLEILALTRSDDLAVGRGLQQGRTIAAYDTITQTATVDEPFVPPLHAADRWQVLDELRLRASPIGVSGVFVWDSRDSPGGEILLRATPLDAEVGVASETAAPKRIRNPLDGEVLSLGGFPTTIGPGSVIAADLDGDGDLDLASANYFGDNLTVFFQVSPGVFASPPLVLGGSGITSAASSVIAADLDGDGDLDLASANSGGDNLTVFFQTSPGVFASSPVVIGGVGTTSGARSVIAADLDGDGDLDLASANSVGDNLTVFFQTTPGVFASSPVVIGGVGTTHNPSSVIAADLDGDGDPDLASANAGGNNLTVFFQTTPGVFASSPVVIGSLGSTDHASSVIAADLDGDGDLDLASANSIGNKLTVFLQTSPGVFASSPMVLGGLGSTNHASSVIAADLDGDGDLDLASINPEGNNLTAFFQTSPGVFASSPVVLGGLGTTDSPSSVTAADLDGDGDLDLASANVGGDNLTAFFQTRAGVYASSPVVLGVGITSGPVSVIAADLDGDGDLDLTSANYLGNNLKVFFQTSPGVYPSSPVVLGGAGTTDGPSNVIAADLDGDGDLDLASANVDGYNLTVFFQTSPGVFASTPVVLGGVGITSGAISVIAADLDGDGDLDLASANFSGSKLTVFFQTRAGVFASSPVVVGGGGTTHNPFSVIAADLDGDGDLDLASANLIGNSLTVFFQTSPGVFASSPVVLGGVGITSGPKSVIAADLDGDGDLDLASANSVGNNLTVFFQTNPGVFASTPVVLGDNRTTYGPRSVIAADLDGDGDLDLASANPGGSNLTVFFQTSPGVFASRPVVLGGLGITDSPSSVTAADLDGDGDLDLVSANAFIGSGNLTGFWGSH